jgi:hypothetical protein
MLLLTACCTQSPAHVQAESSAGLRCTPPDYAQDPYYGYPGYPWDGPWEAYAYAGDIIHPVAGQSYAGR